jgi:hypothetical protein
MNGRWSARTRADELGGERDADAPAPREKCDLCPRVVPVFELVLVEGVAELGEGRAGKVCSGCTTAAVRQGRLTRAGLLAKLGAPAAMVQGLRERERARGERFRAGGN